MISNKDQESKKFAPEDVVQSRALSLLIDLVRERDHYREQMNLQSADNSRLERQAEAATRALENVKESRIEHMRNSDRYSLRAEYLGLVLLSLGCDLNGRKIPEKRREKLIEAYYRRSERIFDAQWPEDPTEAIRKIEKKLGYESDQ